MNKFLGVFQLVNLAFFLAVFIGRSLYLRFTQRVNPFALGAGKKGLPRWFELLLFPWLVLWMLALIVSALHFPFHPFPFLGNRYWLEFDLLPTQVVGVLMILAGDAIFVLALVSFGNSWRIGIDEKSAGALVTQGIFAVSRNPIFTFIDLYFLGTFLVTGSLIFLVFAIITSLALHYQILQEEKFLAGKYAQAYQKYCARTGRYISLQKLWK